MSLPTNVTFWVAIAAGLLLLLVLVYLVQRSFARKRMARRQMTKPLVIPPWAETMSAPHDGPRFGAPLPGKKPSKETQLILEGDPSIEGVPNEGPSVRPAGLPVDEFEPEDFPDEAAAAPEMFEPETTETGIGRSFYRKLAPAAYVGDDLGGADVQKTVDERQQRADRGQYTVWFGTNRKIIDPKDLENGFTSERTDNITYGSADVFVPKAHRFGETGTNFWTKIKRLDFRDDRLRIQRVDCLSAEEMWRQLTLEMAAAKAAGDAAHGVVFIHGFNSTFADAAIRAAQIGFDLKVPGATAFFSWPSRGEVLDYMADGAMIEDSEGAIVEFLDQFVSNSGAEKVHVIAHSMGNRGLLRALLSITTNPQLTNRVRFGQVILAAPDVSRGLFLQNAHVYPAPRSERTTLYASAGDRSLFLSSKLYKGDRAGYFLPYTVAPNIDTIAVPDFDLDLLGHGYFAQAEAVLHDMHDLMRHNSPPQSRQRIRSLTDGNEKLWQVQR